MKITIEIENDSDLKKVADLLKTEHVTIVDREATRKIMLHDLARRYNAILSNGYRFNRNEANER